MDTNNFKDKDFFYPTSFANLNKKQVELFKLALSKKNPSTNIAIMGPIGAGKSSFIRTFDNSDYNLIDEQPINFIKLLWGRLHRIIFRTPNKNNFVYISLADFDFLGKNHSEEATCKQVEAQLYEQLIIAVKDSQRSFPYQWDDSSNYSRKRVGFRYIQRILLFLLILSFFTLFIFTNPLSSQLISSSIAQNFTENIISTIIFLTISSLILLIFNGFPFDVQSITYKMISLKCSSQNKESALFTEYAPQLIRILSKPKDTIYVFEDLDRLKDKSILIHLKNLNRLVNMYCKTPVKFIYCLAEDLLTSESRDKFFDIIIPIIPTISASNSYDQLLNQLNLVKSDKNELSNGYLIGISLFLSQMRQVKNICNNYQIYKSVLNTPTDNHDRCESLFSIVTLKCLYPHFYTSLLGRKDPISKYLFSSEDSYISSSTLMSRVDATFKFINNIDLEVDVSSDIRFLEFKSFISFLIIKNHLRKDIINLLGLPGGSLISPEDLEWYLNVASSNKSKPDYSIDSPSSLLLLYGENTLENPIFANVSLYSYALRKNYLHDKLLRGIASLYNDLPTLNSICRKIAKMGMFLFTNNSNNGITEIITNDDFNKSSLILSFIKNELDTPSDKKVSSDSLLYVSHLSLTNPKLFDAITLELKTNSGRYKKELLRDFYPSSKALASTLLSLLEETDTAIKYIDTDDVDYLLEIVDSNRFEFSVNNIQNIIDTFDNVVDIADNNLIDLTASLPLKNCSLLDNLLKCPDKFYREFITSQTSLSCSESAFIQIINALSDSNQQNTVIEIYNGNCSNIQDFPETLWQALINHSVIIPTSLNVISYYETFDYDSYCDLFISKLESGTPDTITLNSSQSDAATRMIERYNLPELFIRDVMSSIKTRSIKSLPNDAPVSNIQILAENDKVFLNSSTYSQINSLPLETKTAVYINQLNSYISLANSYSTDNETILSVLNSVVNFKDEDEINSLISLLTQQVKFKDLYSDQLLTALLSYNKIQRSSYSALIKKHKSNDIVLSAVADQLNTFNRSDFDCLNLQFDEAVAIINYLKPLQQAFLVRLYKNDTNQLFKLLHSINNTALIRLLKAIRPIKESKDEIIAELISLGIVRECNNGRIFIPQASKPKNDIEKS